MGRRLAGFGRPSRGGYLPEPGYQNPAKKHDALLNARVFLLDSWLLSASKNFFRCSRFPAQPLLLFPAL